MKLNKRSRIWNLGDTSFRRKRLLDDYTLLLRTLREHNKKYQTWNKESQKQFHLKVLTSTNLLQETRVTDDLDRRARTMTNALLKIGLCNEDRRITDVGNNLLDLDDNGKKYNLDKLEENLGVSNKNILFLRQLIKFSIFDHKEKEQFNPFLIMLGFLIKYEFLEENHFKYIVQNLYFGQNYKEMILNYSNVIRGEMTFEEYLNNYLLVVDKDVDDRDLDKFIETGKGFRKVFKNRKTKESVNEYLKFYRYLTKFKAEVKNGKVNDKTSNLLLNMSRKDIIKKAFMTNKIFKIPYKSFRDYEEFFEGNKNHPLFKMEAKEFRKELYNLFNIAKNENLIEEYYDMTVRTFNLTGIIDFKNGRVRISKRYFKDLLTSFEEELLDIICSNKYKSMSEYKMYLNNSDISTIEVFKIDERDLIKTERKLAKKYNIKDVEELESYYTDIEEEEFIKFINKNFPKEKIISILKSIKNREDDKVFDMVTDNANVSTIFEYIIAISWYRISEQDSPYKLLDSMNLSLDGSFLPLSHATGGDGDIIINYKDHVLMLEVTLMNLNNQRRNELEPVIRHATNLTIDNYNKDVYTIFIANDIDYNTSKLFRACGYINLESSRNKEKTKNGVNIFSMKIDEIVECLDKDISYKRIKNILYNEYKGDKQYLIKENWRKDIISDIFN